MSDRQTEGQWINGKWVTTHYGAEKGADDQSAEAKARLQDVSGLAQKSREVKAAPAGKDADDFHELSPEEYAKLSPISKMAYDKRLKLRKSIQQDKETNKKGFGE